MESKTEIERGRGGDFLFSPYCPTLFMSSCLFMYFALSSPLSVDVTAVPLARE